MFFRVKVIEKVGESWTTTSTAGSTVLLAPLVLLALQVPLVLLTLPILPALLVLLVLPGRWVQQIIGIQRTEDMSDSAQTNH